MHDRSSPVFADDDEPLIAKKPNHNEANFDITAMIDLVFMMNIFFLVTMVTAALEEINLPSSNHCVAADAGESVIVSILESPDDGGAGLVFLGEGSSGEPLTTLEDQERQIRTAVEEGIELKKTTFLIKAERNVSLRDVARVGGWAASVQGVELKLAVIEKD